MLRNLAACLLTVLAVGAGCDCQSGCLDAQATAQRQRLLLTTEPTDAVGVLDVRDSLAGAEQRVVVVGRIGGSKPVFSAKSASFVLVDPAAMPDHVHEEGCGDNCPFCSKGADDDAVAMIHCVDPQGEVLATPADQLLNLREGQTAVIQGRARVDESGNLVVWADGIYIRR